ncbi:MAG: sugar phosphate isomerase/epimerase [Ignavibacteriota bacterium]
MKSKRLPMVDEIKRALEIAETIPFKYMVQHIGVSGEEFHLDKFDAAFSAIEQLSLFARQRGVELLLENIPNDLASAARLHQFEELTHVGLNYCFDTGHANIGKGVEHEFQIMKPRIRSTHVHDNDGKADMHLQPVVSEGGTIDWKNTMQLLRSGGDQYPLMLELKDHGDVPHPWRPHSKFTTGWKTSNHDSANFYFRSCPSHRRERRDRGLLYNLRRSGATS